MRSSIVRCLVRRDTYRDSVQLMRVAAELERLPGVARAALMMGTPANRRVLAEADLLAETASTAGPGDLVVAVLGADAAAADGALVHAEQLLLAHGTAPARAPDRAMPRTIAEAVGSLAGANLAIISTPGPYATAEALKALKRGLHVFLFSDNVPIADEVELKQLARKKRLLLMGPDCGTALIGGVPLGFANAVRRGRIGLVGASGTGLQQVSCLIDRLGEGVSDAIGVGGRDLDEQVGGLMMRAGIDRLAKDAGTSVIVLVSKPPAARVAGHVLEAARAAAKPTVVSFLGGDPAPILEAGAVPAATLEEAARLAVGLARGERAPGGNGLDPGQLARFRERAGRFGPGQCRVRGLYSGGTLCREAALILAEISGGDAARSVVDLGADEFTVGRPHPMIDFRLRNERIVEAASDPATAVILLDVVLGYGAHADPAGALAPAIGCARRQAAEAGRALAVVASVCGTAADLQGLARQEETLAAAGAILMPSNAQAARLSALLATPRS